MKIFNFLVFFGSISGVKTDNSITLVGKVIGEFETYVFGPLRITKIKGKK